MWADDGKELEKRSSVSLHWRKGTIEGCCGLLASGGNLRERYSYLGPVVAVALHLQALPKVHQALIDLPSLRQGCTRSLGVSRSLRACCKQSIITYYRKLLLVPPTGQINNRQLRSSPSAWCASPRPPFDFNAKEAMAP